jgi:hypothetical protein
VDALASEGLKQLRRKLMATTIPIPRRWQIRLAGVAVLLLALLTGLAGYTPAYAREYDDDRDDQEVVTSGPNSCTAIANLPIYSNATCIYHETELDDGVTERKNYYATRDVADTVRRAYEAAFGANGWTLLTSDYDAGDQEWEYTIRQGQRRVEVSVEARGSAAGGGTEIKIQEW